MPRLDGMLVLEVCVLSSYEQQPNETKHIDDRERRRVAEELSTECQRLQDQGPSRDIRAEYHCTCVTASITNPGGNVVKHSVTPRNLSRNGIAFLHGQFVYPQNRCRITLDTLVGDTLSLDGTVVRCNHVSGMIHEVGVAFNASIDLALFTKLSVTEQEAYAEEIERDMFSGKIIDPSLGHGSVLIVDGCKLDRILFGTLLKRVGFDCHEAENTKEAATLIEGLNFDLVIVAIGDEHTDGLGLISQLNGGAFKGAILAVSVDADETTRESALSAGAKGFLPKPIDSNAFADLVNNMLNRGDQPGTAEDPIISSYGHDESMRPLMREYAKEVRELASDLNSAEHAEDHEYLRMACRKLIGTSGSYGFDAVADSAREVISTLTEAGEDAKHLQSTVDDLLHTISRIRAE